MGTLKTLDEIGIANGTDKATQFTRTYAKPKGYLPHMETFFSSLRHLPVNLVEIGVGGGESIRTWLEFFDNPKCRFYGIDVVHNTNPYNTPVEGLDRYLFIAADQSDATMWKCLAADLHDFFDIVIDDGSHRNTDIIASFESGWPNLSPGGYWCIEDLATGYGGDSFFVQPGKPAQQDWLKGLSDEMHQGRGDIGEIHLFRELAILRKK